MKRLKLRRSASCEVLAQANPLPIAGTEPVGQPESFEAGQSARLVLSSRLPILSIRLSSPQEVSPSLRSRSPGALRIAGRRRSWEPSLRRQRWQPALQPGRLSGL